MKNLSVRNQAVKREINEQVAPQRDRKIICDTAWPNYALLVTLDELHKALK